MFQGLEESKLYVSRSYQRQWLESLAQRDPEDPVEDANYFEAQLFCSLMGGRVPTELQLFRAVRGSAGARDVEKALGIGQQGDSEEVTWCGCQKLLGSQGEFTSSQTSLTWLPGHPVDERDVVIFGRDGSPFPNLLHGTLFGHMSVWLDSKRRIDSSRVEGVRFRCSYCV